MTRAEKFSLDRYWSPRYWPTWIVYLTLIAVARLPLGWQMRFGRALGRVLKQLSRERRIVRRNLEICFPALSEPERSALLDRHFRSIGLSFAEMGIGWFSPIETLRSLVEIRGREHFDAARRNGKGILLVGAHFTCVEACVPLMADLSDRCAIMYRPQENAMVDTLIKRGRRRFASAQIARDNVRSLIRHLAGNGVVLYFPDQVHLGHQSALLPFFGELAITNIATPKIARISGAAVLTFFYRRKDDDSGYVIEIGPPFDGVPSGDAAADTLRFVARLERFIRKAPDQYLWLYKKFKGRPAPLPNLYARRSA